MNSQLRKPHSRLRLACERLEDRRLLAVTFAEHVIREHSPSSGDHEYAIYPADMDNDGDVDLAFRSSSAIGWYENTDGRGDYREKQTIDGIRSGFPALVDAADMDSDGDMDLLTKLDQKLIWLENTDGKGNLGESQYLGTPSAGFPNLKSIYAADIDNDGDVDALSASYVDDRIAWYENVDGRGGSWQKKTITTTADGANLVYAADVDGDGDMDVLSASNRRSEPIAWYENIDGKGSFGRQQVITTSVNEVASVHAADLDGDGDMDVLSTSTWDNKVAWYENTDGKGGFGRQQVITTAGGRKYSVYAADLDNDGDLDVLSVDGSLSQYGGGVAWYENTDGRGRFGRKQVISTSGTWTDSVHAIDVDADGDMDVVCVTGSRFLWYENLLLDPVPQPAPGDANGDFQFDQVDIVQVLQAAKYLTGQQATWQEGDFNDDGVFNQLDIVAALQTDNYLHGPYAAQSRTGDRVGAEGEHNAAVDTLLKRKPELDDLFAPF